MQHRMGATLVLGFTCICECVSQRERGWNEVETVAVPGGCDGGRWAQGRGTQEGFSSW